MCQSKSDGWSKEYLYKSSPYLVLVVIVGVRILHLKTQQMMVSIYWNCSIASIRQMINYDWKTWKWGQGSVVISVVDSRPKDTGFDLQCPPPNFKPPWAGCAHASPSLKSSISIHCELLLIKVRGNSPRYGDGWVDKFMTISQSINPYLLTYIHPSIYLPVPTTQTVSLASRGHDQRPGALNLMFFIDRVTEWNWPEIQGNFFLNWSANLVWLWYSFPRRSQRTMPASSWCLIRPAFRFIHSCSHCIERIGWDKVCPDGHWKNTAVLCFPRSHWGRLGPL